MSIRNLILFILAISMFTTTRANDASCTGSMVCPDQPDCKLYGEIVSCALPLKTGEVCKVTPQDKSVVCRVETAKGILITEITSGCTECLGTGTGGGSGGGGGGGSCQTWDCLTGGLDQSGWCPIWFINCGI